MKSTLITTTCLAILVSYSVSVTIPDGYLLVLKVLQIDEKEPQPDYYNHASLFQVDFDGRVSQHWNHTLTNPHLLFSQNLFAVDTTNQLVYLGITDRFLGLKLKTGKVAVNKTLQSPNLMFFWNYDYIEEDNAICGVCTGNSHWNWCRVKLGVPEVKLEFLYQVPGTNEWGPISNIYYMDKEHQSLWYFTGINEARGIKYTTGEEIFYSHEVYDNDQCIVHDHKLNRTFTITTGVLANASLAELHSPPVNETKLLTLPTDLRTAFFGTCEYDLESHTMIVLMSNQSLYYRNPTPTWLLFIDVVDLSYKSVPLPEFMKWKGAWPITGIKYMKTKKDNY